MIWCLLFIYLNLGSITDSKAKNATDMSIAMVLLLAIDMSVEFLIFGCDLDSELTKISNRHNLVCIKKRNYDVSLKFNTISIYFI